jgi:hypothetical protein
MIDRLLFPEELLYLLKLINPMVIVELEPFVKVEFF